MPAPRYRKATSLLLVGLTLGSAAPGFAQVPTDRPLSSVVALVQRTGRPIPVVVRRYVDLYSKGSLPASVVFPLPNATSDSVRTISNVQHNVVAKWLDPLTPSTSATAPRFGANADFNAYFGDGWNADWDGDAVGSPPQFNGSGKAGWLWTNHEYISNSQPTLTSAPTGQHLTFATFLKNVSVLANDVTAPVWLQSDIDTYGRNYKKQLGGSWYRVELDEATNQWHVVRSPGAVRYDSTSDTLVTIVGYRPRLAHNDAGLFLPPNVIPGILGDCSGAQTPWGTVITAEENVQDYYGDLETAWTANQRFVAGAGFDPGNFITPTVAPSTSGEFGRISSPAERHNRDAYGFLAEIDPGLAPEVFYVSVNQFAGDGYGHRKVGDMGRARWENATFAVDEEYKLVPGQPIVLYAGDDRRSGRIFKWVSQGVYLEGMTRPEVRALLDYGSLYVAHFAGLDNATGLTLLGGGSPTESNPGAGQWLHLSVNSKDIAPNAAALGRPNMTVGEALRSTTWNGIAGFRNDNDVRTALFTASNKIGVMELNRPEDIEWNPSDFSGTPRLYVAFTNHGRPVALNQNGTLIDPAQHATVAPTRPDPTGAVFAMEETSPANPAASKTFKYFAAWLGTAGTGPFDAANPDNIMIDASGGVWFGTDGNFGRNGTADALYYLDLDPAHRQGAPGVTTPSYGLAFRIVSMPSDAENTGPAFSSDQATIFFSVQHPGEERPSTFPAR